MLPTIADPMNEILSTSTCITREFDIIHLIFKFSVHGNRRRWRLIRATVDPAMECRYMEHVMHAKVFRQLQGISGVGNNLAHLERTDIARAQLGSATFG